MATGRRTSFHCDGSLMKSKSEGTLIDLDDQVSIDNLKGPNVIWNILNFNISTVILLTFSNQTVIFSQAGYKLERNLRGRRCNLRCHFYRNQKILFGKNYRDQILS